MARLPLLLLGVLLCACGPATQTPTDGGAAGRVGGATGGTLGATGGDAGAAGAKSDDAGAAGSPGDGGIDPNSLVRCPEIVGVMFGQVGSNCLRGCELPPARDGGSVGLVPFCRLTDAQVKAFSLPDPSYCVLEAFTTILCTGTDASSP
jgi:hypothetical protein